MRRWKLFENFPKWSCMGVLIARRLKSEDNRQCTNARVPFPVIYFRVAQLVVNLS